MSARRLVLILACGFLLLSGCALSDAASDGDKSAEDTTSLEDASSEDTESSKDAETVDDAVEADDAIEADDVPDVEPGWSGCGGGHYVHSLADKSCKACPDGEANEDPFAEECVVPFKSVSAGGEFACGILAQSGKYKCWGASSGWPDGSGPDADDFVSIAAGASRVCAIHQSSKKVSCWPNALSDWDDGYGYLSVPDDLKDTEFKSLSVGYDHACGLLKGGSSIQCWHADGTRSDSRGWGQEDIGRFSAGTFYTCGIQEGLNAIRCWGENPREIFGDDARVVDDMSVNPVILINSPKGKFSAVSVGLDYVCGIEKDSSKLKCWGHLSLSQPTSPPEVKVSAVSVAFSHGCAIPDEGEGVLCWGDEDDPVIYNQPEHGHFTSLSSGRGFACAIKEGNSEVVCWGDDAYNKVSNTP